MVDSDACPRSDWTDLRSAPLSRRCVANECLSLCGVTLNGMVVAARYFLSSLPMERVERRFLSLEMKSGPWW